MKIIAFVCNGNSFKSIICERFAKELTNNFIIVSAGLNPAPFVNKEGEQIMEKRGLSMKGYKPHSLNEIPIEIDYLVKMGCEIECPFISSEETFNFNMEDYPSETFEDKEHIINILDKKVKELIFELSNRN